MPQHPWPEQSAPSVRALKYIVLVFALALAGCTTAPPAGAPGAKALSPAPPLPVTGARRYHVLPKPSQLRIRVYSSGVLGRIGHAHVVTTSDIEGVIYVQPKITQTGFNLRIPLKSLVIDKPAARRQEGPEFQARLGPAARAGTRRHMLGPHELDAAHYPFITLRSIRAVGPPWYPRITVRITLHGVSRDYTVPTAIVRRHDRLIATGGLVLKQSDFGITPFSALGGSLKVKDALDISFHFVAAPSASHPVDAPRLGRGSSHR